MVQGEIRRFSGRRFLLPKKERTCFCVPLAAPRRKFECAVSVCDLRKRALWRRLGASCSGIFFAERSCKQMDGSCFVSFCAAPLARRSRMVVCKRDVSSPRLPLCAARPRLAALPSAMW